MTALHLSRIASTLHHSYLAGAPPLFIPFAVPSPVVAVPVRLVPVLVPVVAALLGLKMKRSLGVVLVFLFIVFPEFKLCDPPQFTISISSGFRLCDSPQFTVSLDELPSIYRSRSQEQIQSE